MPQGGHPPHHSIIGYFQSQRLGRLHVDDQLKLGGLHHWKLGWFGAVEHTTDVGPHVTPYLDAVGRVGGKAAGPDEFGPLVNDRQTVARRKRDDLILPNLKEL